MVFYLRRTCRQSLCRQESVSRAIEHVDPLRRSVLRRQQEVRDVPKMPVEPVAILRFLAEHLKQTTEGKPRQRHKRERVHWESLTTQVPATRRLCLTPLLCRAEVIGKVYV